LKKIPANTLFHAENAVYSLKFVPKSVIYSAKPVPKSAFVKKTTRLHRADGNNTGPRNLNPNLNRRISWSGVVLSWRSTYRYNGISPANMYLSGLYSIFHYTMSAPWKSYSSQT